MKQSKTWLVIGAIVILVAAPVAWKLRNPGRAFEPVVWQDDADKGNGPRLDMADRLIARGTLFGKTRAEVVEMLGEPPKTGYFSDWDLVYWLGPERGYFRIDSEWLLLKLGPDERVTDYRLVRD
jgi:hypothetical protein